MKKLLLALLVATPAMATTFADDYKSPSLTPEQALLLAKIVQMNGYRCDVINGANRSAWSNGKFTLHCNNWNYSYKIEDKGGRAVVTVE